MSAFTPSRQTTPKPGWTRCPICNYVWRARKDGNPRRHILYAGGERRCCPGGETWFLADPRARAGGSE